MSQLNSKEIKIKKEIVLNVKTPEPLDAEKLVEFIQQVTIESEYLLRTGEEFSMTVEQEVEWIESNLADEGALVIIGKVKDEIVAIANAKRGNRKRNAHVAHLGISVAKKWRGLGVGKALMSVLCQWAKDHPLIESLELSVMRDNKPARYLYENLGFKFIAEIPNAYKFEDGSYQGNVIMNLEV